MDGTTVGGKGRWERDNWPKVRFSLQTGTSGLSWANPSVPLSSALSPSLVILELVILELVILGLVILGIQMGGGERGAPSLPVFFVEGRSPPLNQVPFLPLATFGIGERV